MDILSSLAEALRRKGLARPGDRLLLAVSGGGDSMALLHLMYRSWRGRRHDLAVAHLDHGLRPDSARDAAWVARQAEALGLEHFGHRLDRAARGRGDEATLRRERRAFLERSAWEWGADRVALGHTRDDQAETLLLNLLRGAGSRGLGGMPALRTGPPGLHWIRPLLDLPRETLREWLLGEGLDWREDPSNSDTRYLRNRVRGRLLPLLEDLRPGATGALARTAGLLQDDEDLLARLTLESAGEAPAAPLSSLTLETSELRGLPPSLARRRIRQAAAAVGSVAGWLPEARLVERALEGITGGHTESLDLGRGVRVEIDPRETHFTPLPADDTPHPEIPLPVPGEVVHGVGGVDSMVLRAVRMPHKPEGSPGAGVAWLDESRLAGGLIVRGRRPGDRFRPEGGAGSRSVADFLADCHVPRRLRRRIRLVCSGEDVVWVVGLRADARFVAGDDTKTSIIQVENVSPE